MERRFILLNIIFLMVSILSGCAERTRFYGQLLYDNCQPVENKVIEIISSDVTGTGLPFVFFQDFYHKKAKTDINGKFSMMVKGDNYTIRMVNDSSASHSVNPERRLNDMELRILRERMTVNKPLIFYYSSLQSNLRRRIYRTFQIVHMNRRSGDDSGFSMSPFGRSEINFKYIDAKSKDNAPSFFEGSINKGGFIEYDYNKLPFPSVIPVDGYVNKVEIAAPLNKHDVVNRAYYAKSENGAAYHTIILNIEHTRYNNLKINAVVDSLSYPDYGENTPISNPVMKPRMCGGTLAYDYNGFYTQMPSDDFYYDTHDQDSLDFHSNYADW